MSEALIELSNALAQATQRAAGHLVAVHSGSRGSSSGVIWRPGGVVTADHAFPHDDEIHLTLPDQRVVNATLAGRRANTHLALLKTHAPSSPPPPPTYAASFPPRH